MMYRASAKRDPISVAGGESWLRGLESEGYAQFPELSERDFIEFMNELGPVARQPRAEGPIKSLVLSSTGIDGSFSAEFGLSAFPPHTDGAHLSLPPRWVGLRLATSTSTPCVIAPVLDGLSDDEQVLRRASWLVRGPSGCFLSPILDRSGVLRFDPLRFSPHHSECDAALEILADAVARAKSIKLDGNAGQVVVFDNARCLHWRFPGLKDELGRRTVQRIVAGDPNA